MIGRDPLLDRHEGGQGAAALPVTSHLGWALGYFRAELVFQQTLRRYRRNLNVRFLRPHHALFLSSPIFIVILPPNGHGHADKTYSTQALIADLTLLRSLAASLSG